MIYLAGKGMSLTQLGLLETIFHITSFTMEIHIFFILLMVTEGIIYVSISDYINKMIPSENRATILSFCSMVFSFFMITLFPFIGMIGDRYSLSTAFKALGGLGSVFVLINCCILLARVKRKGAVGTKHPEKGFFGH